MRTIPRNRSARLPGWTVGLVPGFCTSVAEITRGCGLLSWGGDSTIYWAPNYRVHRGMIGTNAD